MAFGQATFTDFGGAASDIFSGFGDNAKAAGDFAEAKNYDIASDLADENEKYTETSTSIKEAQQQRESTMTLGGQRADVAGGGFAESGSSIDLLRDSAGQAALTHQVVGQQGLITEAGYEEQAQSYQTMSAAATAAGNAENDAATFSDITGAIKGIAGVASLLAAPATGGVSLAIGGLFMGGGTPSGL